MLRRLKSFRTTFKTDEAGATAVEYGLLMGLMTLALVGALAATGGSTKDGWENVSDEVGGAMDEAGSS